MQVGLMEFFQANLKKKFLKSFGVDKESTNYSVVKQTD
jgi:hypothetical protein